MKVYECGICDCYHPWEWNGDCREDAARLIDLPADAEIYSMEDRLDVWNLDVDTVKRIIDAPPTS